MDAPDGFCPINNNFKLETLGLEAKPLQSFIDCLTVQKPPFDPEDSAIDSYRSILTTLRTTRLR